MVVVVVSYRQNVHAYPSGGGDYEVATSTSARAPGSVVASALLVDYVLTVAVSISSGVENAASAFAVRCAAQEAIVAVVIVALLTAMNLRGVRESGAAFASRPTCSWSRSSGWRSAASYRLRPRRPAAAPRAADSTLIPESGYEALGGLALAFLMLRAFSSGLCGAHRRRGDQQRRARVPEAQEQERGDHAAAAGRHLGHHVHRRSPGCWPAATGVKIAEEPATQLLRDGVPVGATYVQDTVIGQVAKAVFSGFPPACSLVSIVTGLILVLAANTAFNGFPVLGSILARDGYLPAPAAHPRRPARVQQRHHHRWPRWPPR